MAMVKTHNSQIWNHGICKIAYQNCIIIRRQNNLRGTIITNCGVFAQKGKNANIKNTYFIYFYNFNFLLFKSITVSAASYSVHAVGVMVQNCSRKNWSYGLRLLNPRIISSWGLLRRKE